MTEQEFKKRKFGHSQQLDYVNPRTGDRIECILVAINFDGGTFCLWAIPYSTETHFVEKEEFWVSYEYVFPPKNNLKVV